jgi:hypothetical protein
MSHDEIGRLRRLLEEADRRLAEETRRREEEQRRREEEQRRREEEQRRRQEAERRAEKEQSTLLDLLDGCHSLSLAIRVITKVTLTTKGDLVNPVNRIYPRRILFWEEFPGLQEGIWDELNAEPILNSQHLFASPHQLELVHKNIDPIMSEMDLRFFERDTVDKFVRAIINELDAYDTLKRRFKLKGKVTFDSHAPTDVSEIDVSSEDTIDQEEIMEPATPQPRKIVGRNKERMKDKRQQPARGRRRNRLADQFCVHVLDDDQRLPVYAVEFKAPHKLPLSVLTTGLHEMEPARDVIDQDGDDFAYHATRLVAAVITQLFSYMVDTGVQYGYICTGEAFVFLHIPDDPSIVKYFMCVPNLDVKETDEYRLHRTAVAQVLGFTLNALASDPPSQAWEDAAAELETWKVEYLDVLRDVPESIRKSPPDPDYEPSPWKITRRSYQFRSRCRTKPSVSRQESEDDDDTPPSPSPAQGVSSRGSRGGGRGRTGKRGTSRRGRGRGKAADSEETSERGAPRQYCTVKCIRGLVKGGSLDSACPNAQDHGSLRHRIGPQEFTKRLCAQLSRNREKDFEPLHIRGRTGYLMKATLTSHGYTVVIKATTANLVSRLKHEIKVYNLLRPLQGKQIPICIGNFTPDRPYYYHGQVMAHMLILNWAGIRLLKLVNEENEPRYLQERDHLLSKIRSFGVTHRDVAWRNVLWSEEINSLIMIDFEDATLQEMRQPPRKTVSSPQKLIQNTTPSQGPIEGLRRLPLNQVSGNEVQRKRKHSDDEKFPRSPADPQTSLADS